MYGNDMKWRQPSLQVKRSSQIHSATSSYLLKTSWSRFTIAFGIFYKHFLKNMLYNLHSLWQVFPFRPLFLSRENSQLPSLHPFHQHFLWRYVAEVISGVSHTHLWHQALSQVGLLPYQNSLWSSTIHVVDGMSGGGIGSWSWRYEWMWYILFICCIRIHFSILRIHEHKIQRVPLFITFFNPSMFLFLYV